MALDQSVIDAIMNHTLTPEERAQRARDMQNAAYGPSTGFYGRSSPRPCVVKCAYCRRPRALREMECAGCGAPMGAAP